MDKSFSEEKLKQIQNDKVYVYNEENINDKYLLEDVLYNLLLNDTDVFSSNLYLEYEILYLILNNKYDSWFLLEDTDFISFLYLNYMGHDVFGLSSIEERTDTESQSRKYLELESDIAKRTIVKPEDTKGNTNPLLDESGALGLDPFYE